MAERQGHRWSAEARSWLSSRRTGQMLCSPPFSTDVQPYQEGRATRCLGSSSGSESSRSRGRRSRSRRSRRKHHRRSRSESSSAQGARGASQLAASVEPYVIRGGQRVCCRGDKLDGLQDQSASPGGGRESSALASPRSRRWRRSPERSRRPPERALRRATSWLRAGSPPIPYALLCPVWPMLLPKTPASPCASVARPAAQDGGAPFPFVAWPFGQPLGASEGAAPCGQRDAEEGEEAAGQAWLEGPGAAVGASKPTRAPPLAPSRRFQHAQPCVPALRRNLSCEVGFRGVEIRRETVSGLVRQSKRQAGRGPRVSTVPVILEKQTLSVEGFEDRGSVGSVGGKATLNLSKRVPSSVANHAIVPGLVSSGVTYLIKDGIREDERRKMHDFPSKALVKTSFQSVNKDNCEETYPMIIEVPGTSSVEYSGCSKCFEGLMPVLMQQSQNSKSASEGVENCVMTRSINSLNEISSESCLTNNFTDHLQTTTIQQSMDQQSLKKGQKNRTQENVQKSRRLGNTGYVKNCRGDSEVTRQSTRFRDKACGVEEQDKRTLREVICPLVGEGELKNIQSTQTSQETMKMQRSTKGSETVGLSSETEHISTRPKSNSRLWQIYTPVTIQKVHSSQRLVECGVCTEEMVPGISSRSLCVQTDNPHPAETNNDTPQYRMKSYEVEFHQGLNKIQRYHVIDKNSVTTQTPLLVHHPEDKCLQSNLKQMIEQSEYHDMLPLKHARCLESTAPLMPQERKHFTVQNERDSYYFGIAPEMSQPPKYATSDIHPNLTLPKQNNVWQTQILQTPNPLSLNFADKGFLPYTDLPPRTSWQPQPHDIPYIPRIPEPSDSGKKEINVSVESECQDDNIKKIVLNVVGPSENSLCLKNSKSISCIADTIAQKLVERLKGSTNSSIESASSCLEKASVIINRGSELATQTEQPSSQTPNSTMLLKKNIKTSQNTARSIYENMFRRTNPSEIQTKTDTNDSKFTIISSSPAYVDSLGAHTDWLQTWRSDCDPNERACFTNSKNKIEESINAHKGCDLSKGRATISSYQTQKIESATINIWPKSHISSGTSTLFRSSSSHASQKQVQFSIPMASEIQLPKVSMGAQRSMSKKMQSNDVKHHTEEKRSSNVKKSPSSHRQKNQRVGRETSPSHACGASPTAKPSRQPSRQPSPQTTEEALRTPVTHVDVKARAEAGALPSPKLASLQPHRVRRPSLKEARRVERPASRRVLQPRAVSSVMRAFRELRPERALSDLNVARANEPDADADADSASPEDTRLKLLWSRSCIYSP